jgi:transcriptional regulatory protein GAL4
LGDNLPPEVEYPTTYSAIIAQASLAVIANKISNMLSASTRHDEVDDQVGLELEDQLSTWRASLQPYFYSADVPLWFRGPRAVVLWKEQNLRLMLWHGA